MDIERGLAPVDVVACVTPSSYFAEITPSHCSRPVESLSRIEQIVGVLGDTQRGKRPFPHPFPARMPMEVAQAAVSALTKPGDIVLDPMTGSGVVPRAPLPSDDGPSALTRSL